MRLDGSNEGGYRKHIQARSKARAIYAEDCVGQRIQELVTFDTRTYYVGIARISCCRRVASVHVGTTVKVYACLAEARVSLFLTKYHHEQQLVEHTFLCLSVFVGVKATVQS